ncbi:MAG: hypothetical protein WC980_07650 [Candidatus Brocadiia bacterium]
MDFNSKLLFWIVLIVSVVAFINIRKWVVRSRRRAYLRGREILSTSEIYDRFYNGSNVPQDAFYAAWNEIAKVLGVNAGQIRPDDKMINLKTGADSAPLESDLEWLIIDSIRWRPKHAPEPNKLLTLNDVVRLLVLSKAKANK